MMLRNHDIVFTISIVASWCVVVAKKHSLPKNLLYRGINLSGAEYHTDAWGAGTFPGEQGIDFWWPATEYGYNSTSYYVNKTMNFARLPFRWERLQPARRQPFNETELIRMRTTVDELLSENMTVYLDMHNYGRYHIEGANKTNDISIIGESPDVPISDFADAWARLAMEFNDSNIIFALMNEPHDQNQTIWYQAAQAAINAIRATGAINYISVIGGLWGSAHWYGVAEDEANEMLTSIQDPNGKILWEAHVYMDDDGGMTGACNGPTVGRTKAAMFTDWLRANDQIGVIPEISVGYGSLCKEALDLLLYHLENNSDVYAGWAYWAGGHPFIDGGFLSLEPGNGTERVQMEWLEPHLAWDVGTYVSDPSPAPNNCANEIYSQCSGGASFGGDTCCPAGYYCKYSSDTWSDCKIGDFNATAETCSNWLLSQCGGLDFNGTTCCPADMICTFNNTYWSDCQPYNETISTTVMTTPAPTAVSLTLAPVAIAVTQRAGQAGRALRVHDDNGAGLKDEDMLEEDVNMDMVMNKEDNDIWKETAALPNYAVTDLIVYVVAEKEGNRTGGGGGGGGGQGRSFAAAVTSARRRLNHHTVINLRDLPAGTLSIRAVTNPEVAGSVRFTTDRGTNRIHIDDIPPYDKTITTTDTESPTTAILGTHTVTATPYRSSRVAGPAMTALSLTFTFISVQVDANVMKIVPSKDAASASLGPRYTRFDVAKTFTDANSFCVTKGGKLATPKTYDDYVSMKLYLPITDVDAWIGIQMSNDILKYIDGTTVTTARWREMADEVSEGTVTTAAAAAVDQLCVAAIENSNMSEKKFGRWVTALCTTKLYFICSRLG